MRYSRSQALPPTQGTVHKYWRCHNRAFLLQDNALKELYLKCTEIGLKHRNTDSKVLLHAFGVMSNHVHQVATYQEALRRLSAYMRVTHGVFGSRFNRRCGRTGAVVNERPKTSLVQNSEHAMRVQFYVEANPIRAGVCKAENLKLHPYSSYRFYAYGIVDKFTKFLTPPSWYMSLGSTPQERQARYRSLFMAYLRRSSGKDHSQEMAGRFIGDDLWRSEQSTLLRERKRLRCLAPPPFS